MFRFTIRDMLWLIALAAVSLGWWRHHVKTDREHLATVRAMNLQREIDVQRSAIKELDRVLEKHEVFAGRKGEVWLNRLREESLRRFIADPPKKYR